MKAYHLLLVALFACILSLSPLSGASYAASSENAQKQIVSGVDINTADQEKLVQLPGIGPVTAEKIIKYRTANGKFKSIDELTNVKGIGDKTLVKIKPYLYKI